MKTTKQQQQVEEQQVEVKETIEIEKIKLEKNKNKNKYVPQKSQNFIDHGKIMKTLAIAVRDNLPAMLIGESGTGKTSAIRNLAYKTNNGLRRVNLNGGTTADELVGRLLINDKGTYWVDGVLTEAMRNGEWIVLDEINAALPEVLFVLQSVLDDDGYLVLSEKDDKEIVHKHKNFRLFATCNPPEYAGTKEMNKALLSRFAICINAEFPPEKTELEIIKNQLGAAIATTEVTTKLLGLANETRKDKELERTDYAINTRDVLNTLRLTKLMTPIEALSIAFANKLENSDKKALKILARLHLPATIKEANKRKKHIKTINDIKIKDTFVLEEEIEDLLINLETKKENMMEICKKNIGDILIEKDVRENAAKGDKFTIVKTFYANKTTGATDKEESNAGDKIASVVKMKTGTEKNNYAIILHHKKLNNSDNIIKKIYKLI